MESPVLRVLTIEHNMHTHMCMDVCRWGQGRPLKSLAEKGISCGRKKAGPLAPY